MFEKYWTSKNSIDIVSLIDENVEKLEEMWRDVKNNVENTDPEEFDMDVGIILSVMIINGTDRFEGLLLKVDDDMQDLACSIASNLASLSALMNLEEKGLIKRHKNKYSLTKLGKEVQKELAL